MENSEPNKLKSQSSKLKAFKILQKNLATAGITPDLVHQSYPFNGTILFGFLMLNSHLYGSSAFIIYDAETIADYTQSVYAASVLALIILSLLYMVFKANDFFEFIDRSDFLVNTCESQ